MDKRVITLAGCVAFGIGAASAFDLTPDRGYMAQTINAIQGLAWNTNGVVDVIAWNVDPTGKFGPAATGSKPWSLTQWRDQDGKRKSVTDTKLAQCQYDFNKLNNGWFTPAAKSFTSCNGSSSGISSGWQDTYKSVVVRPPMAQSLVLPSVHARVDPTGLYSQDINPLNNEAFLSLQWTNGKYWPMANVDIPARTYTLGAEDSVFYGAYSANSADGNVNITATSAAGSHNYTLTEGKQRIGFQGRRVKLKLTGGGKNKYVIKAGSKVTAEMLGHTVYGPK